MARGEFYLGQVFAKGALKNALIQEGKVKKKERTTEQILLKRSFRFKKTLTKALHFHLECRSFEMIKLFWGKSLPLYKIVS
ncbi:hypothetical protein [Escherichia albertii]|uniref:hypothetical protein n=1 Tax=Escherichia albertii TaxID=208962 RepID=UPI000DE2CA70|nr:hypothetical protein [Escherichia albertii]